MPRCAHLALSRALPFGNPREPIAIDACSCARTALASRVGVLPQLRSVFRALDINGSGRVDKSEYLRFSMWDALTRSVTRLRQIFSQWDRDESGFISPREFRLAMRSLGFADVPTKQIDQVARCCDPVRTSRVADASHSSRP